LTLGEWLRKDRGHAEFGGELYRAALARAKPRRQQQYRDVRMRLKKPDEKWRGSAGVGDVSDYEVDCSDRGRHGMQLDDMTRIAKPPSHEFAHELVSLDHRNAARIGHFVGFPLVSGRIEPQVGASSPAKCQCPRVT